MVKNKDINKRVKNAEILKAAQSWSVFLPATLSFHSIWVILLKNVSTKTSEHVLFLLFCLCKEKWLSGFRIVALYIFLRYIPHLSRKQMSMYWLKGDQIASTLEIMLKPQLIMGGCLKPLCLPSHSGQTPTLLWAGWLRLRGVLPGVLLQDSCATHREPFPRYRQS